ncbi:hypothetical protein ACSV9I_03560 [Rhizobium sp. G187]|uniref:hypothetical protein n=1 Tax=Rhizobium sp. G187 TaxID=3451352 RepID=UPI003EE5DAED
MRIGDNTIYSTTYNTPSRQSSAEPAPSTTTATASGKSIGVEADVSAKTLTSSLWILQTNVYYSKDAEKAAVAKDDLASEFSDMATKSLAERLREQYLESHGLTEEDVAALPDEERKTVEDDIQQFIKRQMGFDEDSAAEDTAAIAS